MMEILIVVTIISFLSMAGLAAYVNFEAKQRLSNEGKALISVLRDTQKRAQSGEKPESCPAGTKLDGWKVKTVNPGLVQYEAVAVCNGVDQSNPLTVPARDLSAGIAFDDSFEIFFKVISGEVLTPTTITMKHAIIGNYEVKVYGGGGIDGKTSL